MGMLNPANNEFDTPQPARATVVAAVTIRVQQNEGAFTFLFDGDFVDQAGNFDFAHQGAKGCQVDIRFSLAEAPEGMVFKPQGRDAIWILEKCKCEGDCPSGPYEGDEFSGFATSDCGQKLSVTDVNNDGELYRYSLRFDYNGQTVVCDPDARNGTDD